MLEITLILIVLMLVYASFKLGQNTEKIKYIDTHIDLFEPEEES